MSVRERLNRSPAIAAGIALVLIVFGVWYLWRSSRPEATELATQFYFTVDEGKTTFAAGFDHLPPFEHEGKQAVRARVFSVDGGVTQTVMYLEKFAPDYRTKVEAALNDSSWKMSPGVLPTPGIPEFGTLVKKPGGKEWYPIASPQGSAIAGGSGSEDASGTPVEVFPQ